MIIISASFTVPAARRDEIIALCAEHSARSRAEPGCVSHHIHADCEDPARLFFHEEWQDEAAVAAHFAVPESGGERPEIRICRADAVSMEDLA